MLAFVATSCSQFSNSITSKSWHNINAKYNALWIAKVNYAFVEDTLFQSRTEDYTKILPVFVPIDTLKNAVVKKELEEVIKKSSLVAERHSNSKFLDEAYLLLGKARILKGDFLNAGEVFKYINSNGKVAKHKHAALIALMRTYIETNDLQTANEVSNVIKTLPLKGDNVTEYFLTKAYFHQKSNEPLLTAAIIDEALKIIKKSERKARLYYLVGQIYETNNRLDLAKERFGQVLKNKPNYDLAFNANVNQLAASNGSLFVESSNTTAFQKMLDDRKNQELKDKIYLKMGDIEVGKSNFKDAEKYYLESINYSKTNEQQAIGYFAIANMYYDYVQDYSVASKYYDSTLIKLPQTHPQLKEIIQKATSLSSFIRYNDALQLEDSLQVLAKLNPVVLDKKLDEIIAQQESERKKMLEMAENLSRNTAQKSNFNLPKNRWELYDPVKINKGKAAFTQTWGSRQLTDNWRRRDQQAGGLSVKIERLNEQDIKKEEEKLAKLEVDEKKIQAEMNSQKKNELLAKIPTTPEKLEASFVKQQEALFQLGKIYKLQFNELDKARFKFQTLISKFPDGFHTPEALYFLSLMAENPTDNVFKSQLLARFPLSNFSRQLEKGNLVVTSTMENEAQDFYKKLYEIYSSGDYESALNLTEKGLSTHFGTSVEDKIAFLKIYILAKGKEVKLYQKAIEDFKIGYPASKLLPKVITMETGLTK